MRSQYCFQDVVKFCSKLSGWIHVVVFDARIGHNTSNGYYIIAASSEGWLRPKYAVVLHNPAIVA